MHHDLRCSACGHVGRHHASALTLHRNESEGFSLIAARCPSCGDLAVAVGGTTDAALAAAGAEVRRLDRVR